MRRGDALKSASDATCWNFSRSALLCGKPFEYAIRRERIERIALFSFCHSSTASSQWRWINAQRSRLDQAAAVFSPVASSCLI